MKQKAVFFDIDGTLFEHGKPVLDSTKEAISTLRKRGHLAFVCSGRSRVMIPEKPILEVGFDGVLASCGTYAEYHNRPLFEDKMPAQLVHKVIQAMRTFQTMYILEGTEAIYYDEAAPAHTYDDWYIKEIQKNIPGHFLPIGKKVEEVNACKLSMQLTEEMTDERVSAVLPELSLLRHEFSIGELIPKDKSKATGIDQVCKALGIAREDTIAVGDSINDVDMLSFAGIGICMGNGTQPAREAADYVTTPINEHGIYHAMEHFGLLDAV